MKALAFFLLFSFAAMAVDEEPVMMSGDYEISSRTRNIANQFERDVKAGGLRYRVDRSLDAIIKLAVYKLKRVGKKKVADQILKEWQDQFEWTLVEDRGITSHAPLSQWIADKTLQLEFLLGKDVMASLRLTDLIVLNFAIPVVLACEDNVDLAEYGQHFVRDDWYGWALGPVTVYWTTFFSCVGASWGTGFLYCSPIASGSEFLTGQLVAPNLNEFLWDLVCH